ncbi:hypothetical protein GCM10011512_08800 [Tersicoccus solisilvae]|uniref:DUF4190 domain-containing protein n=1 Tax=Tersicoccus solisilvae TaxID=1882339 RepID=A0ABQ1NT25_9MICC|nr:hypothetical protein [Tersicoccus solisilvae]GGC84210.1 hypothetical protein GCM10011512_08800 [Tersicoccus solisilvae]
MSDYAHLNQYDDAVGRPAPFDPLRLCVVTTVAAIACVAGPLAVLVFALVAIGGYLRARRAGLMRSKCRLGDTRLVIAYLAVIAVASVAAIPLWVTMWLSLIPEVTR